MPFSILQFKIFFMWEVEAPIISRQSANKGGKVVSPKHRQPLLSRPIPNTYFCQRLNRSQKHSAAGKFKSMNNPNDTIGNLRHSVL
jgi:hypothetical protein